MRNTTDHFVKYKRNSNIIELGKKRPTAVLLLLLIVNRAKNTEGGDPSIEVGEALIGDWKTYCKSERCYRTDKYFLKTWQISTFRTTNKGTVAKLRSRAYFDINWKKETSKTTDKTPRDRQATDEQLTTNIEIRDKRYRDNTHPMYLTQHEIWAIAYKHGCDITDVINTYNAVINPDNVRKYKIKSSKLTLDKWVARAISKKEIQASQDENTLALLKLNEPKPEKANLLVTNDT